MQISDVMSQLKTIGSKKNQSGSKQVEIGNKPRKTGLWASTQIIQNWKRQLKEIKGKWLKQQYQKKWKNTMKPKIKEEQSKEQEKGKKKRKNNMTIGKRCLNRKNMY